MTTVYLSLGSNLGDRAANLADARRRLQELGAITATSALYETEPVEVAEEQPWFLNCVVAMKTELEPRQLLTCLLALEQSMGRKRSANKAPRTVDIDILLFGNLALETPGMSIPHPRMHQRRFVLQPLAEIAPDARHPLLNKTAKQLLDELPASAGVVRKVAAGLGKVEA
ncbi:MAG: 2-amino-4-hydroxy-6-hydroxymethyldihydropteridine diphosphokinase [Acidobacteriia bacterium]|nr:2-amino-4-hydroxy-6-hydroxymethyldihydropteridine diphosphokinase [Terriglobia bacterium]